MSSVSPENVTATGIGAMPFESLEAIDVVRHYGSRRHPHAALDGVDVALRPGSAIGIVGESGSGKSTLSRILVGLERATSGTVALDGTPIAAMLASPATTARFRRTVQYIAQDTTSSFDPRHDLLEAVSQPLRTLYGLGAAESRRLALEQLDRLGLDESLAHRRPHRVSGGQRQRFAIARALVLRPSIILCDEVVSALDVSVQGSILNLIKRYCRETGAAMAFVSHGLPATAFVSSEIVVMKSGRIVERGATADVIERPVDPYTKRLLEAYAFTRDHARPLQGTGAAA